MIYQEYPFTEKTYIVHHTEGCGVVESPRYEREIVFACDDYDEATKFGTNKYPRDGSGWDYDGFTININTCTDKGKQLLKEFHERCAVVEKRVKEHPELYETYNYRDGQTITFAKNPMLDG